jgi:hypothetical protein
MVCIELFVLIISAHEALTNINNILVHKEDIKGLREYNSWGELFQSML